jgi:hypothetical protein
MTVPTQCLRCHSVDVAPARLAGGALEISTDATHRSPVDARVCLACGAVMLTASEPGKLGGRSAAERHVQEYDF